MDEIRHAIVLDPYYNKGITDRHFVALYKEQTVVVNIEHVLEIIRK